MKHYLLVSLLLLSPLSAAAAENDQGIFGGPKIDDATRAMEEAGRKLVSILGIILHSIPQYETPVILPNGDILIKRVQKQNPAPAPDTSRQPDGSRI
ncbi:MAG: hypothetical protein JKY17_09230 [Magnetovibrio sp.]|nr:hypothetical protein [Magnetovibrio sp.]